MDSCNGSRRPPQRLLGGMAGRLVAVLTNRSWVALPPGAIVYDEMEPNDAHIEKGSKTLKDYLKLSFYYLIGSFTSTVLVIVGLSTVGALLLSGCVYFLSGEIYLVEMIGLSLESAKPLFFDFFVLMLGICFIPFIGLAIYWMIRDEWKLRQ